MASTRVRICYLNAWATSLEPAASYLARVAMIDLRPLVSDPSDSELLKKATLDRDWYGENVRCFAGMSHPGIEFLPAFVAGPAGVLDLLKVPREPGEERWLVTMGQQPMLLGEAAGKVFALLAGFGVRHLFYAFDEASRFMPCFRAIAPHLSVLIHDEAPLEGQGERLLSPACIRIHRSWVANFVPYSAPFCEEPDKKILFLGSMLGLTEHRRRQIDYLKQLYKDRFHASHDHTVSVADRLQLNRFKVSICPEGRKFTTRPMAKTHTDRPFWSGCLGAVPVSEDSKEGGRLEDLAAAGLILRYPHGDLKALAARCEEGLAMSRGDRRRLYEHFNRNETVGAVVAAAIARAPRRVDEGRA